jgi:hypothetical protein
MTAFSDLRESAEAILNDRVLDPYEVAILLHQLIARLDEQARAKQPIVRPTQKDRSNGGR